MINSTIFCLSLIVGSVIFNTARAETLLERFDYTGQWNSDPNLCGVDSDGFLQIEPNVLFFLFERCDITKEYDNEYDIGLDLICQSEGEVSPAGSATISEGDHGIMILQLNNGYEETETTYEPCFNR
jgi:hypothetical protein